MPLTCTLTFVWGGEPTYFDLILPKVMPDSQKEWNSAVQRFITYDFLQITLLFFLVLVSGAITVGHESFFITSLYHVIYI